MTQEKIREWCKRWFFSPPAHRQARPCDTALHTTKWWQAASITPASGFQKPWPCKTRSRSGCTSPLTTRLEQAWAWLPALCLVSVLWAFFCEGQWGCVATHCLCPNSTVMASGFSLSFYLCCNFFSNLDTSFMEELVLSFSSLFPFVQKWLTVFLWSGCWPLGKIQCHCSWVSFFKPHLITQFCKAESAPYSEGATDLGGLSFLHCFQVQTHNPPKPPSGFCWPLASFTCPCPLLVVLMKSKNKIQILSLQAQTTLWLEMSQLSPACEIAWGRRKGQKVFKAKFV